MLVILVIVGSAISTLCILCREHQKSIQAVAAKQIVSQGNHYTLQVDEDPSARRNQRRLQRAELVPNVGLPLNGIGGGAICSHANNEQDRGLGATTDVESAATTPGESRARKQGAAVRGATTDVESAATTPGESRARKQGAAVRGVTTNLESAATTPGESRARKHGAAVRGVTTDLQSAATTPDESRARKHGAAVRGVTTDLESAATTPDESRARKHGAAVQTPRRATAQLETNPVRKARSSRRLPEPQPLPDPQRLPRPSPGSGGPSPKGGTLRSSRVSLTASESMQDIECKSHWDLQYLRPDGLKSSVHETPPRPQAVHESPPHPRVGHETPPHPHAVHETPPRPQAVHETPPRPHASGTSSVGASPRSRVTCSSGEVSHRGRLTTTHQSPRNVTPSRLAYFDSELVVHRTPPLPQQSVKERSIRSPRSRSPRSAPKSPLIVQSGTHVRVALC